jgi:hypothetical protein
MESVESIEELADDDILEGDHAFPEGSGTFPSGTARSIVGEEELTGVSDVTPDLAMLADVSKTPQLRGAVEWNELERPEAYLVSLVCAGFTVEAILETSPLDDDRTLDVLANLVNTRIITLR